MTTSVPSHDIEDKKELYIIKYTKTIIGTIF